MMAIGHVSVVAYLFATFLLWRSQLRRKFLFQVIKYTFVYLFYTRVYPHSNLTVATMAFYSAIINKALMNLNTFCFQYENLILTTNNGFGEVIALNLAENLRESLQMDLEDDLREEIYDQARRHKLKIVKDRRRSMGIPVPEFDDLSEDENLLTEEELQRCLGVAPPVRGQERLFRD